MRTSKGSAIASKEIKVVVVLVSKFDLCKSMAHPTK